MLSIERSLRYEGFGVATADSGDDGLALCRRRPPDVAVLDIGMPARDGFSVLPELRRQFTVAVGGDHPTLGRWS